MCAGGSLDEDDGERAGHDHAADDEGLQGLRGGSRNVGDRRADRLESLADHRRCRFRSLPTKRVYHVRHCVF